MKIVYTPEFLKSWDRLFHWKYALLRWWDAFLYIPTNIKHYYQRATRGWADCDTWDLWDYQSRVLPQALRHMAKYKNGCPSDLWDKKKKDNECHKWQEILEKIAKGFEAPIKLDNLFWSEKKNKKLEKELQKEFEEGVNLFKKYYRNLWD